MKQFLLIFKLMVACFLIVAAPGNAFAQKLPVIDNKETVAIVNDEPIFLDELNQAIAASHKGRSGKQKAGRLDFSNIMERLINRRLILLEARNMGLDELPAMINTMEQYSKDTLIRLLMEERVKDIKADDSEVEMLYEKLAQEWKINALKFKKKADAKKIEAEIKANNDFDTIAKKAVADKIAEGGEAEYLKNKDFRPQIAKLVSNMQVGSTSPVISFGKNEFVIFKLEGSRLPEKEDTQAKEQARPLALNQKRAQTIRDYYQDLRKRYVKVDEKLLDSLDYESKTPGFDNLLKDDRIVAEITGEKPITVGELSGALKKKFYHGIELAIESKRVNKAKKDEFERMIEKRILLKEALAQELDKTESYKERVKEHKNSLIFGTFIDMVVAPDIKLKEKELKTYYKKNIQKYTSPLMMRIKSLIFKKRGDAVEAIDKLMKGTDFAWLSAHADGQVDKTEKGLLNFEGRMLILSSMPEGVQKAVSDTKPGDFRLYASPDGHYYVLYVYHVVAPKPQPFDEVKKEIAQNLYNDKLKKEVEIWADKLKEYYPVKVYRKDLR